MKHTLPATLLTLFALGTASIGPATAQDTLIKDATIYTLEEAAPIQGGDVWLRGETIAGVGKTIQGSSGSQRIEGEGLWVTPGIVNAYTRLGALEVGNVSQSVDTSAARTPFAAGFDIAYGINPASSHIAITRLAGITRAASAPIARSSVFAGFGALLDLGDDADAVFKPRAFMSAVLDEQGARIAGGGRGAAHVMLRESLREASGAASSDRFENLLSRIDVEALKPVVRGDVPLFVEVDRASDIRLVLALKDDFRRLNIVLVGANEGWMVADEIARAKVPVITGVQLNLPTRFETLGATLANAARLQSAGVLLAIASGPNGDDAYTARRLMQLGGIAVSYGLAWEDALAAVTINPAKILGADDQIGSLSPGKRGDVVIWDGDPFELTSRPITIFIDGRRMPMESRQTQLLGRYLNLNGTKPYQYRKTQNTARTR